MSKRIVSIGALLLSVVCIGAVASAENRAVASLKIHVTVVPAVQATAIPASGASSSTAQGAELNWASMQQNHILTQQIPAASLIHTWGEASGACAPTSSQGTRAAQECEITLNTSSFVAQ